MDVQRFIAGRPCLEEIEGYLDGLRFQLENRDRLTLPPQYEIIDAEVLGPLYTYRERLKAGKELPYPSGVERKYTYMKGRRPQPKRKRPHEQNDKKTETGEQPHKTSGKSLDRNKSPARRKR